MKISRSSWHYRYLKWLWGGDPATISCWGVVKPRSTFSYFVLLSVGVLIHGAAFNKLYLPNQLTVNIGYLGIALFAVGGIGYFLSVRTERRGKVQI